MFMLPQHFQQWERYVEGNFQFGIKSLNNHFWGLLQIEIDRSALSNDRFSLLASSGIMPDGLAFDMPDVDALPQSRSISEHLEATQKLDVYLAIPVERPGRQNVQLDGSAPSNRVRYRQEYESVVDETTGQNQKRIGIARKQFRIMFGDESLDELTVLKLGELMRSPSGEITLNDDYVPTCLKIGASQALVRTIRKLLDLLSAKSRSLSEARRQLRSGAMEFGSADVSNFWFLHTVNSFIPVLSHYARLVSAHPESLYLNLAMLAGALTTFSPDRLPGDVPAYQHDRLDQTFGALFEHLRQYLEIVISSRCVSINLEKIESTLFVGRIQDDRLLDGASFYLGVSADVGEADLISKIPVQVKICSHEKISLLVGAGMPGLAINHTPRPPADIPVHMGFQYFRIEARGDYWELVKETRNMAIYVPSDFQNLKLELLAIKS